MEKQGYTPQYPLLCAPLHVGHVTLRSRMCSAPMGFPDLTEDGCLTEGAIAFYETRARGGAAVVTVSEACVDYVHGKGHGRLINLDNPGVLSGLTNAARAIRRFVDSGAGGKPVSAQLMMRFYRSQAYYDSAAWRGTFAGVESPVEPVL